MKRKTAADLGETAVFWGGFAIKQTVLYSIKKDVQRGDFKGDCFPVRGITLCGKHPLESKSLGM